jgi:hypothetical protein
MDIIGIDAILKTSKDFSKMLSWVLYQVNNDLMNDDASSMTRMVKSRYVESKQFYSLKNGDWISLDWSNQLDVILAIGIF